MTAARRIRTRSTWPDGVARRRIRGDHYQDQACMTLRPAAAGAGGYPKLIGPAALRWPALTPTPIGHETPVEWSGQ